MYISKSFMDPSHVLHRVYRQHSRRQTLKMVLSASWLEKRQRITCPTSEPGPIGEGCSPDLLVFVQDFLDGLLEADETARRIAEPFEHESDPAPRLRHLWVLLCKIIVELPDDGERAVHLVAAIQLLPTTPNVDWPQLPGFLGSWCDLYKIHFDTTLSWEQEDLSEERETDLRRWLDAIGRAESEMLLHRLGVENDWGYEALSMVCWDRSGIDILLSYIYGWMSASTVLATEIEPEELSSFRYENGELRSATMEEHWNHWTAKYLELSKEGSPGPNGRLLSDEGRRLAGNIHLHIREGVWDGEGGISSVTGV